MADYVSIRRGLEAKRAAEAKEAAEARKVIEKRIGKASGPIAKKFASGNDVVVTDGLGPKLEGYGLLQVKGKRPREGEEGEGGGGGVGGGVEEGGMEGGMEGRKKRKKKKRRKKLDGSGGSAPVPATIGVALLSFAGDDDDVDVNGGGGNHVEKARKNPDVNTEFLPDAERDAREIAEREAIAAAWLAEQEEIKKEKIQVVYSYWDGGGHRREVTVSKGTSIRKFLAIVKNEFAVLKACSPDQLIYVKEDVIIPHHYTFYDLIATKARGKSGPLFNFGVHDDVRVVMDARVEMDASHAGKVMQRRLYETNKHVFPYSRWEVYDPDKDYGTYTIHDVP